ncbi:hypothetical protein D3C80_2100860 [compost metagenome]
MLMNQRRRLRGQRLERGSLLRWRRAVADLRPALLKGIELLGATRVEGPGERCNGQQADQHQPLHLFDSLVCVVL